MAAAVDNDNEMPRLEEQMRGVGLGENAGEADNNGDAAQQVDFARVNQLLNELTQFIRRLVLPVHRLAAAGNRRENFGFLYNVVDELIRNGVTLKSDSKNLNIIVGKRTLGVMELWNLMSEARIDKGKLKNILNWLDVDRDLYKAVFRDGGVPVEREANNSLPIKLLQLPFDNQQNMLSRNANIRNMENEEDGIYGYICRHCPLGKKEKVCFISVNEFKPGNSFKNHFTSNKSKSKKRIDELRQGDNWQQLLNEPSFIDHIAQHFLDPNLNHGNETSDNAFAWNYVAVALPTGTSMTGHGNDERIRNSWDVFWKWVTRARKVRGGFNQM